MIYNGVAKTFSFCLILLLLSGFILCRVTLHNIFIGLFMGSFMVVHQILSDSPLLEDELFHVSFSNRHLVVVRFPDNLGVFLATPDVTFDRSGWDVHGVMGNYRPGSFLLQRDPE